MPSTKFKILYINSRTIVKEVDDLRLLIETELHDIKCITEIWLSNEISVEFLDLSDFIIYMKDRNIGNETHGGVLIAVNFKLNPNAISIDTDLEVCFINLNTSCLSFKLGVVYCPQTFNGNSNQNLHKI